MSSIDQGLGQGQPPGGQGPPPGEPPGGWGPPPGGWDPPPGAPPGGWGPPPGAPPGAWGPGGYGPPGGAGGPYPGAAQRGPRAPFSPGDAVSFAWERVKADPGTILATIVVGFVLMFFIEFASSLIVRLLVGTARSAASLATGDHGSTLGMVLGPLYSSSLGIEQLIDFVVSSFFIAGIMRFSLKVARGEPYSFNDLFSGTPFFLSVLVANLIVTFAVVIGSLCLIVPGIIVALGLSMALPLIVDRQMGPIDALQTSWKLTEGSKGPLAIFGLICAGLLLAGTCACVVGIFLVLPILYIGHMYIYLTLSGQPVARVARAG